MAESSVVDAVEKEAIDAILAGGAGGGSSGTSSGHDGRVSEDSLASEFATAQDLFRKVDEGDAPATDEAVQADIDASLALLERCSRGVREASVFSKGEKADDVNTENLKFLLVEFYSGMLTLRKTGGDRLRIVTAGQELLFGFLDAADRLGLLPAGEKAMLGIDKDESVSSGAAASGAGGGAGGGPRGPPRMPPAAMRQAKIARFKTGQAAKRRLAELAALEKRLAEREAAAPGGPTGIDEDVIRERTLLVIDDAVRRAVDEVLSIQQELPILHHMAKMRADEPPMAASGGAGGDGKTRPRDAREDERMRSRDAAMDPDRPGLQVMRIDPTMAVTRETIKASVFQPDHRLPTMSLEEFAERERAEAEERSKKQAEAEAEKPVSYKTLEEQGREDDEEEVDRSTLKDRAWDDWKDNVPRGIGNTKRY